MLSSEQNHLILTRRASELDGSKSIINDMGHIHLRLKSMGLRHLSTRDRGLFILRDCIVWYSLDCHELSDLRVFSGWCPIRRLLVIGHRRVDALMSVRLVVGWLLCHKRNVNSCDMLRLGIVSKILSMEIGKPRW